MKKSFNTTKSLALFCMMLIAVLSLSSCATLFTGTTQKLTITSDPPGADVVITGVTRGQTPVTVDVKKELKGQQIELKKTGYEPKVFTPTTTFNSTAILNIFVPIGFIVDALTGSLMKYNPTDYNLKLEKQKKN